MSGSTAAPTGFTTGWKLLVVIAFLLTLGSTCRGEVASRRQSQELDRKLRRAERDLRDQAGRIEDLERRIQILEQR